MDGVGVLGFCFRVYSNSELLFHFYLFKLKCKMISQIIENDKKGNIKLKILKYIPNAKSANEI